jgi:protease IV
MSDTPQPPQFVPQIPPVTEPSPSVTCNVLPPKKRSMFAKFCSTIGVSVFLLSLVMNFYLIIALAALSGTKFEHKTILEGNEDQVVAVYNITGVITDKASAEFDTFYQSVKKNENVKAVVLRINSPGGTVSASDAIYNRILALKDAGKTVIVSMGGVAASGGYYISAPADEIYAEPSTITGSIGVIAQIPNLEGTLNKIGMSMLVIKSTNASVWKDQLSSFREPQSYEIKHLLDILNKMQDRFETIVSNGRGDRLKPIDEPYDVEVIQDGKTKLVEKFSKAPFNGNIYLGQTAVKLGLVDKIGYLVDACDRAAELAKLDKPKVIRYSKHKSMMEKMMSSKGPDLSISTDTLDKIQTPRMLMLWKID